MEEIIGAITLWADEQYPDLFVRKGNSLWIGEWQSISITPRTVTVDQFLKDTVIEINDPLMFDRLKSALDEEYHFWMTSVLSEAASQVTDTGATDVAESDGAS